MMCIYDETPLRFDNEGEFFCEFLQFVFNFLRK